MAFFFKKCLFFSKKYVSYFALFCFFFLSNSCEFRYDPSRVGDSPAFPASAACKECITHYREYFSNPFSEADLNKTMSLSQLLDIALYNNPSTRASWLASRAAAYSYRSSLSAYYPTITYTGSLEDQWSNGAADISGVGATFNNTNNSAASATNSSSSSNSVGTATSGSSCSGSSSNSTGTQFLKTIFHEVALNYLLLDFGGRDAQAELAFQALLIANWQHNTTMQQVIQTVLNAYTSYLGNKSLVIASEQDVKDSETVLAATMKMQKAGVATFTDVLSAQANLEQMRLALEQNKGAAKTALAALLISLGMPSCTSLCVEELPDRLPVVQVCGDVCALIEMAKQRRPDVGVAIAQVKQQQAQLAISFSAGMPTLAFNGSMSRVFFLQPKRPSIFNNSMSIDWNVPIFNGFYYLNQQRQIREQILEALANVDIVVSEVENQVVTNYYALITAEASIPSAEASQEYSKRAFVGTASQYKVGTSSIQDVLVSLTTLSDARAQQVVVRTQWAAALANLAFSVGVLYDTSGTWQDGPSEKLYRVEYREPAVVDHGYTESILKKQEELLRAKEPRTDDAKVL